VASATGNKWDLASARAPYSEENLRLIINHIYGVKMRVEKTSLYYIRLVLALGAALSVITCSDSSGNNPAFEHAITTPPGVGGGAPKIITLSPDEGSVGVAVDEHIVLTFNESLDGTTTGRVMLGVKIYDQSNSTITFSSCNLTDDTVIINPNTVFAGSKTYASLNVTGFKDADGDEMAVHADDAYTFTTAALGAPEVVALSPANSAQGVAVDKHIVLTFNESLDGTTVGTVVLGSETYDISNSAISFSESDFPNDTVILNPNTDFAGSTTYGNIQVAGFKDAYDNEMAVYADETYNFTTAASGAPQIIMFSPADSVQGVAVDENITLIFNKSLDETTLGTVVLDGETYNTSNSAISFSTSDLLNDTVTIDPDDDFEGSTTYVNLHVTGFTDVDFNEMAVYSNETYSFTTEDLIAPVIESITPSDDATRMSISQNIMLFFSEELDETVKGSVSFTDPAITYVDGTNCEITIFSNTVIIDPYNNFDSETIYSGITIKDFQDLAGNVMAEASMNDYDFTTAANETTYFTGNVVYTPLDNDGDSIYEVLQADVELYLGEEGEYNLYGRLLERGTDNFITSFISGKMEVTAAAAYSFTLQFSGEQIFRSGIDGPYDLELVLISPATIAVFATDYFSHKEFGEIDVWLEGGSEEALDNDGNGLYDYIEVTPEIVVRAGGDYRISVELSNDQGVVVKKSSLVYLNPGMSMPVYCLPVWKMRRVDCDGPYHGLITLYNNGSYIMGTVTFDTIAYDVTDFAYLLETDGQLEESGFDSNGNGAFDSLQVSADINLTSAGLYVLEGRLFTAAGVTIYAEQNLVVSEGPQNVMFEFSGLDIYNNGEDGPYQMRITVKDSSTLSYLDSLTFPDKTAAYEYTDFESEEPEEVTPADIELNGVTYDEGVDADGNGFYEGLRVDVGLELVYAGYYHWSARLLTGSGTDLGAYNGSGSLPEGVASIEFIFNGAIISATGEDGPYYVRGLLMYCDPCSSGSPNLVAIDVAETEAYSAGDFQ
jgi:methionine-rich copper-binding protein CopC